jgi:hypothetical protein
VVSPKVGSQLRMIFGPIWCKPEKMALRVGAFTTVTRDTTRQTICPVVPLT